MVRRIPIGLAFLALAVAMLGLAVACAKQEPTAVPTSEPVFLGATPGADKTPTIEMSGDCPSPSEAGVPSQSGEAPTPPEPVAPSPFTASLGVSHAPKLYEPFTITYTLCLKPDWPAQEDLGVWLEVPGEAVWLSGENLRWRGDLAPGEQVTLEATLAFVKTGYARVLGRALKSSLGSTYSPVKHVDLYIAEGFGEFALRLPIGGVSSPPTPTDPALQELPTTGISPSWASSGSLAVADYGWEVPPASNFGPTFLVIPNWEAWDAARASHFPEELTGPLNFVDLLRRGVLLPRTIGFRFENAFFIAVFDQRRPTGGYGFRIAKVLGRGGTLTVEIEATSPREGWPVEVVFNRPYSVVSATKFYLPDAEPVEVVFLVNGKEAGRQTMVLRSGPLLPYDAPYTPPLLAVPRAPRPEKVLESMWLGRLGNQTGNAVVYSGPASIAAGQKAFVPITVNGVNDPDGLAAYGIRVTFDPAVVTVSRVVAGHPLFGEPKAVNIDNVRGAVSFMGLQSSAHPGPVGDIVLAYLEIAASGPPGSDSHMDVTVGSLADSFADDIPAVDSDGTVTIQ